MHVGVLGRRFRSPGRGNPFPQGFVLEVVRRLVEQLLGVAIGREVHSIAEQLSLTVLGKAVR